MPSISITNRRDLLLIFLYSPGKTSKINEPFIGRTKLVKAIFLFNKEVWKKFKGDIKIKDEELYEFFPWNYGPFSKQVYDDITFFSLREFIEIGPSNDELIVEEAAEINNYMQAAGIAGDYNEFNEEKFSLTTRGQEFSKQLYTTLTANQQKILQEFKARIQDIPLRSLLRYVYKTYPDQTTLSKIRDQII